VYLALLSQRLLEQTQAAFTASSEDLLGTLVRELQGTLLVEVSGVIINPVQVGPYGIQPTVSLLEASMGLYHTALVTSPSLTPLIHKGFEAIEGVSKIVADAVNHLRRSLPLREYDPAPFAAFNIEIQGDELPVCCPIRSSCCTKFSL
jgi:hypothetical protein